MKFDKLQALMAKLSDKELADFEVSPWSSFATSRPQVKMLFGFLKQQNGKALTDEEISIGTQIEAKRLSDLANKLLSILEHYLASSRAHKLVNDIEQDLVLLEFYSEQRLWKNYLFVEKRLEKRLTSNEALYPQDFILLYKYYTDVKVNEKYRVGRKDHGGFEQITYYLGALYVYENLKYQIEALNRRKILGTCLEVDKNGINTLLTLSEKYQSIPTIRLMTLILKLIVDEYKNLASRFKEIKDVFLQAMAVKKPGHLEHKNLAEFLLNICIAAVNRGNFDFAKEYIAIIEFMSSENLLFDHGELLLGRLKNIMAVSRKANKQEWAMGFLLTNIDHVYPKEYREILVGYYRSLFSLDAKDLKTAYDEFPATNLDFVEDTYLLLSIKKLWIQILVETKQFTHADPQVRSFLRFVKNAAIDPLHKEKYLAFANNVQKLWRNTKSCNFNTDSLDALDLAWLNKVRGNARALNKNTTSTNL